MRTVEKTRTQSYKVYIAKDGKEFDAEEECKHHEMILDGTRIICPDCNGQGGFTGKWVEPYEHWEGTMGGYYEHKTCPTCNGKGYLEKKITWQ